jgi:hypothetical protein
MTPEMEKLLEWVRVTRQDRPKAFTQFTRHDAPTPEEARQYESFLKDLREARQDMFQLEESLAKTFHDSY